MVFTRMWAIFCNQQIDTKNSDNSWQIGKYKKYLQLDLLRVALSINVGIIYPMNQCLIDASNGFTNKEMFLTPTGKHD